MNRKRLAICDSDKEYLSMLQAYLLKKNPADFEILAFDSLRQALASSKEEHFEILLVSEGAYDTDVKDIIAKKVFILQEDGASDITGYSMISKFQSMERIMARVLDELALDEECSGSKARGHTTTRLISFYSPDRHKAQSIASLTAAQVLSDMGNKVLYVSMQSFSGFEELLGIRYESDVTDFMYFVLKHSDRLLYKLESIKRTIHGVDYLPPALDYYDLLEIKDEDWKSCFDMLLYSTDYEYVIVDLTETSKGFYSLLKRSDAVYFLSAQDAFSNAAYRQFEQLMRTKELTPVLEKSVNFNMLSDWENYALNISQLSLSPLGAHMKGILKTG